MGSLKRGLPHRRRKASPAIPSTACARRGLDPFAYQLAVKAELTAFTLDVMLVPKVEYVA